MKQVVSSPAGISVVDVPVPNVEPGTVLVRTAYSCISPGTELRGVQLAEVPLWRRAVNEPGKAAAKFRRLASGGVAGVRRELGERKRSGAPLGYSAAGEVVEVGAGVDDVVVGDLVACAGAGVANHAEYLRVPRNLLARVPDGVDLAHASLATLGAIALHGVRRAEPTLGETFAVVGLGVVGQLTVQILLAHGGRVLAADVDEPRVKVAVASGATALAADDPEAAGRARRLSAGVGVDGVLVCASSPSSDVIAGAFALCRKKARVVLVGDVGLNLRRADIYEKELEFRISTSYGPGRYDRRYEEEGLDYPISYVRWTEQRNLAEVLRLMADGRIDAAPLVGAVYELDRAADAYEALKTGDPRPLTVALRYRPPVIAPGGHRVPVHRPWAARRGAVRLGVIGAGSFTRDVHLPNLAQMPERFAVRAVATRTPTTAAELAHRYGAAYATTEPGDILADPDVDAVLVATRHDSHARLVVDALRAGKHVLVEKPLALTRADLDAVTAQQAESQAVLLLTGYNRRFAPLLRDLASGVADRDGPLFVSYLVNAGPLPADHWTLGPQGGGRNLGEACHMYDALRFLVGHPVVAVAASAVHPSRHAQRADENFVVTLRYADGSVAAVQYSALGNASFPKERITVLCDGRVHELVDFRILESVPGGRTEHASADKGHAAELAVFAEAIAAGGPWPVPFDVQTEVARTALDVQDRLRGRGDPGTE